MVHTILHRVCNNPCSGLDKAVLSLVQPSSYAVREIRTLGLIVGNDPL